MLAIIGLLIGVEKLMQRYKHIKSKHKIFEKIKRKVKIYLKKSLYYSSLLRLLI